MTNPSDELRVAINRLRSLTEDATEEPWISEDPNQQWGDDRDHYLVGGGKILATFNSDHNGPLNATYAAAMHPGVTKALVGWLEAEEFRVLHNGRGSELHHALAVARAINTGGQP